MKKLTKKLVIDYHEFMADKFGVRLIFRKGDIPQEVYDVFPSLNQFCNETITADTAFLDNYAITIPNPFGKTIIYLPWVVGVGTRVSLFSQVRRLAHECQHAVQIIHDGDTHFTWAYLGNPALRANYEALAMHPELELHFWYYGKPATATTLSSMAKKLKAYRCGSGDIAVTEKHLVAYNKIVARGSVSSEAGKAAIGWLDMRL
jgi:hypothetical protein